MAALAFESPFIRLEKMVMTKLLGGGGKQQKKAQSKISPAVNKKVTFFFMLQEHLNIFNRGSFRTLERFNYLNE